MTSEQLITVQPEKTQVHHEQLYLVPADLKLREQTHHVPDPAAQVVRHVFPGDLSGVSLKDVTQKPLLHRVPPYLDGQ